LTLIAKPERSNVERDLEQFLDEYLAAADLRNHDKTPLFRSAARRTGMLTDRPMHRIDAYEMIRRRTAEAGFKGKLGCRVFPATGITAYRSIEGGGTLEKAQAMAAYESPRATKLYDRRGDGDDARGGRADRNLAGPPALSVYVTKGEGRRGTTF
jgi:hypothetical protein